VLTGTEVENTWALFKLDADELTLSYIPRAQLLRELSTASRSD